VVISPPSFVSIVYTAHEVVEYALVIILQHIVRDAVLYRGSTIHRKFSVPQGFHAP